MKHNVRTALIKLFVLHGELTWDEVKEKLREMLGYTPHPNTITFNLRLLRSLGVIDVVGSEPRYRFAGTTIGPIRSRVEVESLLRELKQVLEKHQKEATIIRYCVRCRKLVTLVTIYGKKLVDEWDQHTGHLLAASYYPDYDGIETWIEALEWVLELVE